MRFYAIFCAAAALAAGVLIAGSSIARDEAPMTSDELRAVLAENTLHSRGPGWQWAGLYREDGTMSGRSWGSWGQVRGAGVWEINAEGHLCRDWDNNWGGGGRSCIAVYRDGDDQVFWEHKSGTRGEVRDGTMTLKPGNPFDL